ncbi:MAG: type II toxin-antitoxin system Phd/YefM family antitoxin [Elusimicrobia bacterium]|nr:type II toxin-antitoxin system Phd/YefM family antitoxin [Elusimicrobiota bacterium]
MHFYSIAEFKAKASQIVRAVKTTGENVLITVHGGPMVFVSPASEEDIHLNQAPQIRDRVKRAMKERKAGKVLFPGKRSAGA